MSDQRPESIVEMAPIRMTAERYDVAIVGGGLAGLTLAIQIKRRRPATSVLVLEKREGPAPLAAFKVGESTVLSGAHYFAEVCGLRDHLEERQYPKAGLRFFCPAGDNSDISRRLESGPPVFPAAKTYQIDRGSFENELAARARAAGVDLQQGCRVQSVDFGDDVHTITFTQFDADRRTTARWVVDAAGRSSFLKRKLGLSKDVDHNINSSWLRLRGGLDIDELGAHNEAWLSRMAKPQTRMFSTNHLLGEGYWVWLIPLSSGPISIGVCADQNVHPFEEIESLDALLGWMRRYEPQLAAAIEPRLGDIEDFLRVRSFAYDVERAISPDRWALVGEAAAFADPFLSPGSDMICYSNTFACDVVTREIDGEDVGERIDYYNDLYHRTFAHVLSRTEGFYPVFGNAWVTAPKLAWDAYVSHTGIVMLTAKNKLDDLEFMRSVDADVDRIYRLNINMHRFFREWHELEQREWEDDFYKSGLLPAMREAFNAPLQDYDDDGLRALIREQADRCEALAVQMFHRAASSALEDPPPEDARVDPYRVSLKEPGAALNGDGGLTLADANARVEAVEWLWLDYVPSGA